MPSRALTLPGFAPVGLAAPPGILGPEGTKGARGHFPPRPALSPMLNQKIESGPKTQGGPGAERAGTRHAGPP